LFKFLSVLLISFSLISFPVTSVANEVFQGGWEDGVEIQWACPTKTKGAIPFAIKLPDGKIYRGVLSCGQPV